MSGLFIGGIQNKETADGVHVPIERRPIIIRLNGGKICLDELRQNGRGFFLVDEANSTGEQFSSRRLSRLKWERSFLARFMSRSMAAKSEGFISFRLAAILRAYSSTNSGRRYFAPLSVVA